MKVKILGSGGSIPIPRIGCQCQNCKNARKFGKPYKRNTSCLFLSDINVLIDCPEDINSSLNENGINEIEYLLITHWHPDHTFGLRLIMEHCYDTYNEKAIKQFELILPEWVYSVLKNAYAAINYQLNKLKTANLNIIQDREKIKIKNYEIIPISYEGKGSDNYGYLITNEEKNILYTPCDTINFKTYSEFIDLDLWITQCGCFSDYKYDIGFDELMNRIKEIRPEKTILVHIEEEEINMFGIEYFDKMKQRYNDINFEFSVDGLEIKV